MSTKIYNGLIIKEPFFNVYNKIIGSRMRFEDQLIFNLKSHFAEKVIAHLDVEQTNSKSTAHVCNLTEISEFIGNMISDKDNNEDELKVTFPELWIQFFPYNENCTIAYAHDHLLSERSGYSQILNDIGFTEYMYYNNTDQPDNVSDREWAKRELVWDNILARGNGYSFENVAATMTVVNEIDTFLIYKHKMVQAETILDFILDNKPEHTSEENRRKRLANRLVRKIYTEDNDAQSISEMIRERNAIRDTIIAGEHEEVGDLILFDIEGLMSEATE